MDKLLVVLEEALEAGGYTIFPMEPANPDVKMREFEVSEPYDTENGPHFIVTVEYA